MWSSKDNIVLAAATYYINNNINNHNISTLDPTNTENPPNYHLPEYDSYAMHCGEIIITTNNLLVFSCAFCNYKYDSISKFSLHLSAKHLHSTDASKNSSKASNVNACEAPEEHSPQIQKYIVKNDNSYSLDDLKPALSLKTKRKPFDEDESAKLNDQVEESELWLKSEKSFDDSKTEKLDDEASLSSLETHLDSNIFFGTDRSYNKPLHKCNKCDRVFQNKAGLRVHVLSHTNVKQHKCTLCGVEFKYKSNLKTHIRRHNGVRKFSCELCDKRFFTSTEANRHHRLHTGEKPFVCFKCGRSFSTSGNLAGHMKRHDNNRPKHCEVCGKNFYDSSQLKWHMASHSIERPFVCTYCPSSFTRNKTLKQHIKLHLNAKEYACNMCFKSFNQRPALLSHINNNHKKPNK